MDKTAWMFRGDRTGNPHRREDDCGEQGCTPIVVIDPENRDGAYRLLSLWFGNGRATISEVARFQRCLLEYADPTPLKPDEPHGLGAVAEDKGEEWVHFGNSVWIKAVPNAGHRTALWDQFSDDVKVLSLGRES